METQKIQISSGHGPAECELAVGLYLAYFMAKHPGSVILKEEAPWAVKIKGRMFTGYKSVLLTVSAAENVTQGVVKWVCPSPVRPGHERKTWFIEVTALKAVQAPGNDLRPINVDNPDKKLLKFETFHSPGPGGQNVNKVETGVRVRHIASGLSAASTSARSQWQNRRRALKLLNDKLIALQARTTADLNEAGWRRHSLLERGNPFIVFRDLDFKEKVCGKT